ncbi:MAG: phosphate ABC transporter permease subunit PstC [Dethiobacteria bacterium]|nr:phosphate ABC transporter permease subunit PstC [Bacillota bacterium]
MRSITEKIMRVIFWLSGIAIIVFLTGILFTLLSNSIPAFTEIGIKPFFIEGLWRPGAYGEPTYSINNFIVGTFMVTLGALAFAVPLGVAAAAYLSEIASPWERELFKPIVEVLAGIPSVVLGFIGLVVLAPLIAKLFGIPSGINALNGAILVGIMALPTIITLAEDAITAVPSDYRHASLALGGTRWQTIWKVTIPAAFSGITAATMLGMGRAIGETMTVLMVTGNMIARPSSFLDSVRTLSANIAIDIGDVVFGSIHFHALFVVGLVLFLITFIINLLADILIHRKPEVNK